MFAILTFVKPYETIVSLLKTHNIAYQEIDHEPVYTSVEAAAIRGLSMKEGAKSLLVKVDNSFYLFIIPGDKRLDGKKVKMLLSAKKLRFATAEEVKSLMFCEVGSCYPFGNIIGIEQYVDPSFSENEYISFNPGIHTKSIRITWNDYQRLLSPTLEDLCKEGTASL